MCYLRLTLGTETVPCGLFSVITDGKDRHGLKLGEVGPTFSSFNVVATKITGAFCIWVKAQSNDCSTCIIDLKQQCCRGYVTFPFVIVFGGGHDVYVADNAN